ncbi:hypothetical protein AMATHDRAFT_8442 [Amanita thiersii Skay4041]|uniref:DFDF domain-containing protein n=1 Tax=Amanita thiersii Skay4041 TaxID=703135 RepID=A0A2A9N6W4_9AGAR|nr:hypothetical protein AMATHDRAFT_8442 [Amanita thiersii Skay4041]
MALSFIGKPISLISHSDVRYRGILAGIDPAASTIQLSNVYSMGTESRRPPAEFIPPVQEPYQYIIFRASEVKDLAVDEPTPRRSVHDDPAVLGASAPLPNPAYSPYPVPPQAAGPPVPQPQHVPPQANAYNRPSQQQPPQPTPQAVPQQTGTSAAATQAATATPQQNQNRQQGGRRNNSVQSAAVSLETVERAIGDLRVSNAANVTTATGGGRGGRRGRGQHRGENHQEIKVPNTDFDFESSNAKFDKAALAAASNKTAVNGSTPSGETKNGEGAAEGDNKPTEEEKQAAYNPSKSFFDSLSSSTHPSISASLESGRGNGRGRRGGAGGRNRREEERERNVATFGEPGGVGLMGPGAYVGGWGGYGRRSARPRRGGGGGSAAQAGGQAVPTRG